MVDLRVVSLSRLSGTLSLMIAIVACGDRERAGSSAEQRDSTPPSLLRDTLRSLEPAAEGSTPPVVSAPVADSLRYWITWTLADTGFGPIVFGMTPAEANAVVGGSLVLPEGMTPDACDFAFVRGVEGLAFMIEAGRIVRIDVRRSDVRTNEGAGFGDAEARISELYAGRVRVSPHPYTDGHNLTVLPRDSSHARFRLVFETDGRRVVLVSWWNSASG